MLNMRITITSLSVIAGILAHGQAFVIDPSFDPGTGFIAPFNTQVVLQPDGRLLCAGFSAGYDGSSYLGVTRLEPDGSRDLSFQPLLDGGVASISLSPDGRMIIAGSEQTCNGDSIHGITRLMPNGTNDPSFQHTTDGWFFSTAITPGGNVFAGGTIFSPPAGQVTYDEDGNLIEHSPLMIADCLLAQPDGKVIAGGRDYIFLARFQENGAVDASFASNITSASYGPVIDLAQLPDGRILIIGNIDSVDGQSRSMIARIQPDGSLDESFDPGTGFNDMPWAELLLPDGDVLVAGDFTTYNGATLNGSFVRLNDDGSLDTSYAISGVLDMVRQPDGKIVLAGFAIDFDGDVRNGIMRIMPDVNTAVSAAHVGRSSVWPNPAQDVVTVQRDMDGPFEWAILDAIGALVMGSSDTDRSVHIPVRGLVLGAYTFRVIDAEGVRVSRFVKE